MAIAGAAIGFTAVGGWGLLPRSERAELPLSEMTLPDGSTPLLTPLPRSADSGTQITTDAVTFTMPSEPSVEALEVDVLGMPLSGTAWQIGDGDRLLQVLLIEFPEPITNAMAESAFDGGLGGMARRGDGEIAWTESLEVDGVLQRRARIDIDGGSMYVHNFATGPWVLSVIAVASGTEPPPPPDFVAVVDSVSF